VALGQELACIAVDADALASLVLPAPQWRWRCKTKDSWIIIQGSWHQPWMMI
jgi:hypothetical protein